MSDQFYPQFKTSAVAPQAVASVPSYTPVPGSLIDTSGTMAGNVTYVVSEIGGINAVALKMQGSLDAITWFDLLGSPMDLMQGTTNSLFAGPAATIINQIGNAEGGNPVQYATSVYRYYQIVVQDHTSGSHGVVEVVGYAA